MDFWNDGTNSWCSACFENWTLPFFLKLKDFMAMWELGQQHGFPVESLKFWLNGIWSLRDLSFVIAYYNHLCDSVRKAFDFPWCQFCNSYFLAITWLYSPRQSFLRAQLTVRVFSHLYLCGMQILFGALSWESGSHQSSFWRIFFN